jgi:hypothetical protein
MVIAWRPLTSNLEAPSRRARSVLSWTTRKSNSGSPRENMIENLGLQGCRFWILGLKAVCENPGEIARNAYRRS